MICETCTLHTVTNQELKMYSKPVDCNDLDFYFGDVLLQKQRNWKTGNWLLKWVKIKQDSRMPMSRHEKCNQKIIIWLF